MVLPGPGSVGIAAQPLLAARSRVPQATPTDVESASLADEPPGTPRTPTSGSAEPSLADVESASQTDLETQSSTVDPLEDADAAAVTTEQVVAQRWQCDLCFEPHGQQDIPWKLGDDRCGHSFCRRCVLGSIRWGGRCPYDNVPIPPIIVCGAMGTGEYIYHEKREEARRTGGIMCAVADCPGVAPAAEGRPPQSMACVRCGARHCGRSVCGAPWTEGHRCWDIVEEERRLAEQDIEMRLRHRTLDAHFASTRKRLVVGPRFRPCPTCGVMVEHVGGCNMVYHENCRTRWCFACRRVGTCTDFDCRAPGSGPPTPRGPSMVATAVPSAKKATTIVKVLAAMVMLLLSLAVYACLGFHVGVPRNGFLGSAAEICESASCSSPGVSATAVHQSLDVEA